MTRSSGRKDIGPGGDRRSVTVTFGYPDLRTLVAPNLRWALVDAEQRWGRWETIESISTPETIHSDVTGRTKALNSPGRHGAGSMQTVASKLLSIGYQPRPGEVATVRFARDELPRTYRHTKRRTKRAPDTARGDELGMAEDDDQ